MNRAITLTAGEDLNGKEGAPIKVTAGKAHLCTAAADHAIGILTLGGASGAEVDVTFVGDVPVRLSDTVTRGEHLVIAAGGDTCDGGLVSGSVCIGIALQDGVAGDLTAAYVTLPLRYEEG